MGEVPTGLVTVSVEVSEAARVTTAWVSPLTKLAMVAVKAGSAAPKARVALLAVTVRTAGVMVICAVADWPAESAVSLGVKVAMTGTAGPTWRTPAGL